MRRCVAAFASGCGVSGSTLDDVRACVSEAVTNCVLHAFCDGRAPGTVTVAAESHPDDITIRVRDDGIGFHPRLDSPGLGFGLPMISAMSASMTISPAAKGGTEISMVFARASA